jgi:hypothetical protein
LTEACCAGGAPGWGQRGRVHPQLPQASHCLAASTLLCLLRLSVGRLRLRSPRCDSSSRPQRGTTATQAAGCGEKATALRRRRPETPPRHQKEAACVCQVPKCDSSSRAQRETTGDTGGWPRTRRPRPCVDGGQRRRLDIKKEGGGQLPLEMGSWLCLTGTARTALAEAGATRRQSAGYATQHARMSPCLCDLT